MAYVSDHDEIAGTWGFINEDGKEVITPQYIYANDFYHGIAFVCKGNCTIDKKWDNKYNTGRYWTEEELWGTIDKEGNEVIGHRALLPWERDLVASTCNEHDFGPAAMTMMLAGLRRGEALYLDVDRDVDFIKKTITVRGSVTFPTGNQPQTSEGKTASAQRTVPLVCPLEKVLRGRHSLLCSKEDGTLMSEAAFVRKINSYLTFLERKVNGCTKRWYGKTKKHKALLAAGKDLPTWHSMNIRCHDFRVDFCTRSYEAGIPIKTLQAWMGHADTTMILEV